MEKTKKGIDITQALRDAGRLPKTASRRGAINYPHFTHNTAQQATADGVRFGLGALADAGCKQGFQYAKSLNPSWGD